MFVVIKYQDGIFSMHRADTYNGNTFNIVEVSDDLYEAYQQHLNNCHFWQEILLRMDNEIHNREDAQC